MKAQDCMTETCTIVALDSDVEDCCRILEEQQIRRALVVDENGGCCGIVAQTDIAEEAGRREAAEVVQRVSQPSETPSVSQGSQAAKAAPAVVSECFRNSVLEGRHLDDSRN